MCITLCPDSYYGVFVAQFCPDRRSTSVSSPCRVKRTLCIHGGSLNPRPLPLSGPYSVLPVQTPLVCQAWGRPPWQGTPIGRLPATSPGAFAKVSGSASTALGLSAPQLATCSRPACIRRSSKPTSIRNVPLAACSVHSCPQPLVAYLRCMLTALGSSRRATILASGA